MKINPWTLGLAAAGVVSLASAVRAEEATESVKTLVSSTTLSGYVNTSVHWNPGNTAGVANYALGGGKADRFSLDVVSLTIAKPLSEGEWAAGYQAKLWFGPDANGLGTASPAGVNFQDFAVKNAYVLLRAPLGNGLDFKLGVFDTCIGYETQDAGDNPNYTRSWGNTLEPTQHTGLMASYRFNDILSASVAVANTRNQQINGVVTRTALGGGGQQQSMKTYIGTVTLTAPDSLGFLKGGTLNVGAVNGRSSGAAGSAGPDQTDIYVGATIPTPLAGVSVGATWDHSNLDTLNDSDAIAGYISWQATEKLKLNLRGDYIDDGGGLAGFSNGAGVVGGPVVAGLGRASAATSVEVISATVTLDYALWANVISRLEYRWDHDTSGGRHFASARNNANLLALNVIYKF